MKIDDGKHDTLTVCGGRHLNIINAFKRVYIVDLLKINSDFKRRAAFWVAFKFDGLIYVCRIYYKWLFCRESDTQIKISV